MTIEVYFSPSGGCTDATVKAIAGAKDTILVQAYSFTSADIAKVLSEAKKRNVSVIAASSRQAFINDTVEKLKAKE
jgi:phosphatidylserine/phosphatidylglycerophosphate/cardiolipin synthase-like enzyme